MFRRLGWVIMIALIVAWVTWGLFRFAVDLGRRTALIIGVLAALDALFIWLLATASASVLRYLRNPYQLHRIIRMGAGAGARWAACTIIVEGPALVLVRTRTVDPKTYLRVIDAKLLRNWRPLRPSLLRGEREFWVDKRGRWSGSVAVSAKRTSLGGLPVSVLWQGKTDLDTVTVEIRGHCHVVDVIEEDIGPADGFPVVMRN